MLKSIKESGDYLGQIRNNIPEKVGIIEQSIQNGDLPKGKDGKIRIIELGTGGGESLRRLKSSVDDKGEMELIAVDIIPNLAASLKKEVGTEAVAADAGNLPFAAESVSAINASAIFHEVSSYGTAPQEGHSNMIYGKEAVIKTLSEMNRVLVPGGKVAYRDILAPQGNLAQQKTVEYFHKSWQQFAEWFLPDFANSNPHFYDIQDIVIGKTEKGFRLTAPVGIQRELQRHYLMFRDYLRNAKQHEFGIVMLRSDWINEIDGLKSITFSVDERVSDFIDLSAFECHDSVNGKVYRGDSDQFDKIYDDLIEHYFNQQGVNTKEPTRFNELVYLWKEREGLEHYIYGNVADMLKFGCQTVNSKQYLLFPESATDIAIAPRYYYNRYLKQISDHPEQDGKQLIAFKKVSIEQAIKSLSLFENAPIQEAVLDKTEILEIKEELNKLGRLEN